MFNYSKSSKSFSDDFNVFKFDESLFKNTLIPTYPDTDIKRVDDAFVFQIGIPGYNKDDINVSYENGVLTIKVPLRESEDETENKIKID